MDIEDYSEKLFDALKRHILRERQRKKKQADANEADKQRRRVEVFLFLNLFLYSDFYNLSVLIEAEEFYNAVDVET